MVKKISDKSNIDLSICSEEVSKSSSILYLFGDVEEESINDLTKEIIDLSENNDVKIATLYISSYGGLIDSMFQIYDAIRILNKPINTVCIGKCDSAAVLILSCGKKRFATHNSSITIHGISGESGWGRVKLIESVINSIKEKQNKMCTLMAKHTKKSYDFYMDLYNSQEDFTISPEQAKEYGIIDEIL